MPPVEAVGGRRLHLVERGVVAVVIAVAAMAMALGIHHLAGILVQPAGDFPASAEGDRPYPTSRLRWVAGQSPSRS